MDMARRVDDGEAGGDRGRSISISSSVTATGGDGGAPFMDETEGDGEGDIRARSIADRLGEAKLMVSGSGRDTDEGMKDSGSECAGDGRAETTGVDEVDAASASDISCAIDENGTCGMEGSGSGSDGDGDTPVDGRLAVTI